MYVKVVLFNSKEKIQCTYNELSGKYRNFMNKKQSSKKNPLINFEYILENHITFSISERNEF